METDATFREKVRGLVRRLRETQAKEYEITEELIKLLDANPTTSEQAKQLFKTWKDLWGAKYRDVYLFAGAKDMNNFKRLLKTFSLSEIEGRMGTFLKATDPFYLQNRHALGLFVSSINQHGSAKSRYITPCPHDPKCFSTGACCRKQDQEAAVL